MALEEKGRRTEAAARVAPLLAGGENLLRRLLGEMALEALAEPEKM